MDDPPLALPLGSGVPARHAQVAIIEEVIPKTGAVGQEYFHIVSRFLSGAGFA
jgi:hypothetical protein